MAEIELHLSYGGADQTGSGTASASSVYFDNPAFGADKAVDDNTATLWGSQWNDLSDQWWEYDFGAGVGKWIIEITITPQTTTWERAPANFNWQYSYDNSNWTTLFSVSTSWSSDTPRTFPESSSSSSSSLSSSSSSSSSLSSSSSSASRGPFYSWGEQYTDLDEHNLSWTEWKLGNGSACTILGDPNWGSLQVNGDNYGPVEDIGSLDFRLFTVNINKYASGNGTQTIYIRGSDSAFLWNDVSPSWQVYTTPVTASWRYVQLRIGI